MCGKFDGQLALPPLSLQQSLAPYQLQKVPSLHSRTSLRFVELHQVSEGGRLVVAVDGNGTVCAIIQDKSGGIAPAALIDMLRIAQQTAAKLFARSTDAQTTGTGEVASA